MDRLQRDPLHRQLAARLRQEILSGARGVGQALPSEAEFCRTYGISRSTVRQALAALAAEGLVRTEAGRGSYVQQASARPGGRTGPGVGLVVPQLGGMLLAHLLDGLEEGLAEAGHALTIACSGFQPGGEERAVQGLRRRGVVGLLILPAAASAPPPAFYTGLVVEGFPVVCVDRRCAGARVPWVTAANAEGGAALARHLLHLGHRRLAYLLPRDFPSSSVEDRLEGARRALGEAGVDPGALRLLRPGGRMGDPMEPAVREAVAGLAGEPARLRPTALLCANDDLAMLALAAWRELGLTVPGDLALAGFDDLPYARFLDPPLTTVRQDAREMGRCAVRLLLDLLGRAAPGRGDWAERGEALPVALRLRESTTGRSAQGGLGAGEEGAPVAVGGG